MANATSESDFVQVQLSADGVALAAGNNLIVSNGRRSFSFAEGVAQRIELSYEWKAFLSRIVAPSTGKPVFELVPATPAAKPPVTAGAESSTANSTTAPAVSTSTTTAAK